ncbi:MAG: porin [Caldimonas sp.]
MLASGCRGRSPLTKNSGAASNDPSCPASNITRRCPGLHPGRDGVRRRLRRRSARRQRRAHQEAREPERGTRPLDPGEFEVEQFYVERKINDAIGARAGLFLIPAGLLNENHEPTNFYGVQRSFVETLIIPSTWREGGLSFYGTTDAGIDWNVGLTTGMNLSKWNFAPEAPLYASAQELINEDVAPFQATHQELSLANARRLAQYLSLNYRGIPGLTVGGTYFTGNAVPALATIGSERTSLWETHVRYQPGRWDLSALYARGSIGNTGAANAQFPGTANPLPSKFDGWFAQAAYNVWQRDGYRLAPFIRYERYDMGAGYDGIAPGFSPTPTGPVPSSTSPTTFDYFAIPRDRVVTLGANFYLNPNVVLKLDYQKFRTNIDFSRVDLGLGLQF